MTDITKRAFYPHPPERVWAALTDADALAQWLMPNNFVPEVGRAFEFRVDSAPFYSGITECRVLEIDAPRRMVWSWKVVRPGGRAPAETEICWDLAPHEGGTMLTLTQKRTDSMPWMFRMMMSMGWGTMLKRWIPVVLNQFTFESGLLKYHRMAKPPNRYHHKSVTVPANFAR